MRGHEAYDYIVVGAGSGGCVLAARLSEDPNLSVCLIEDGGPDTSALINVPAGAAALVPTKICNYAYETVPQPGLLGRRGYQPRGRALGGSSAINAMCYIRGQAEDFDHWAAQGATGWDWASVLPDFKISEHNERGADDWHGVGGPLNVADQRATSPVTRRFVQACIDQGLYDNRDFNGARQDGAGLYQVTQKNGRRHSVSKAYLQPAMSRPNLTIVTRTRAHRLITQGARATGVEVSDNRRRQRVIHAAEGVICAGGAFGTPQLLMLSGIGRADDLKALDITPRLNLSGMGQNLHDHPDYTLLYASKNADLYGLDLPGAWHHLSSIPRYRATGQGPLATNYAEGGAFSSTTGEARPDVQLHFVPAMVEDHARKLSMGRGYTAHVCVLRPTSRGSFKLASADPRAAPLIDPNFLATDYDIQTLLAGFRQMREIMEGPAMKDLRGVERHTKGLSSDTDLIHALRARTDTVYHPVGTCRMGLDEDAVCDPDLRLKGMDNVWIADASVMPSVVSGNTNAPTVMIGERAARSVLRTASRTSHNKLKTMEFHPSEQSLA